MNKKALEKVINGTLDERKYLTSKSFGLFAIYYFQEYFKYSLAPYHYEMIKELERLDRGDDIRELVFIMFRESAKTTLSKLYLIWLITFNKRKYINVDSFDKENAERILFDIAYELSNNNRLKADFGILFSKKRGIDDVKQSKISNFITENGIRVEAHSTQESVRGRIHLNQRPDFLLLDDFETNKTKDSQAYTKQIKDHISEALAGMSPEASILYLGNYITEYGNIQFLIDRAKTDHKIKVLNVPVLIGEQPTWKSKYALTDDEAKETGKVSIEDKKRQLGHYVFSYEMMNQPIDEALAEFKKEWIQIANEDDIKHLTLNTFVAIDPAVSQKESADFTGITINRVSTEGKRYITSYKLKVNPTELIDHLFYLHDTYKPEVFGIEETVFLLAIKPFIDEEMRKKNKFFTVTPLKHGGIKKETRIRGLIPLMESKSVFFVSDCSALIDEMRTFPRGQHDDVLDSFCYSEMIAYKPFNTTFNLLEEDKPLYGSIGL